MKECEARFRAKEYEQAAGVCAHREQGLPGAAARAAGAAYELGRGDDVRAWAERLRGQPGEAEVLFYAGLVQSKAGDREAAIATHRRALALAEERDEPRATTRNAYALYLMAGQRGRTAEALAWASESFAAAERSGERDRQVKAVSALRGPRARRQYGDASRATTLSTEPQAMGPETVALMHEPTHLASGDTAPARTVAPGIIVNTPSGRTGARATKRMWRT